MRAAVSRNANDSGSRSNAATSPSVSGEQASGSIRALSTGVIDRAGGAPTGWRECAQAALLVCSILNGTPGGSKFEQDPILPRDIGVIQLPH